VEGWAEGRRKTGEHAELIKVFADELKTFIDTGVVPAAQTQTFEVADAVEDNKMLSISISGDVRPHLVDPNGLASGIDPDTGAREDAIPGTKMILLAGGGSIAITNPVNGPYSLFLTAASATDFSLELSHSDAASFYNLMRTGFNPGQTREIIFNLDATSQERITIVNLPLAPKGLRADISGAQQTTILSWEPVVGGATAAVGYKIYSKTTTEPRFSLVSATASTSFDSGHTWTGTDDIATHIYNVTAVTANDVESFFSDSAANNDRDHDSLTDAEETAFGSDMNNPDTDGDGLLDSDEYIHGTNPTKKDTDGDGYSDYDEVQRGSDPLDPNSVPSTGLSTVISNSIGSRNTIKISDMSGTLPVSGDAITVSAWDANGNALPESAGATPLKLYNHGTNNISGSVLAARFPSGTPTLYKFAINSSKVVITNVKNSTNDAFKVPIVYLNGVTNFVSNSIGNYNTIKVSDMSGTLPASGSPISVKAWDANGSALTESGSAAPLVLYSHGTTSISGSTLTARFPTGSPMIYEFTVQSAKVLITNVKSSTDGLVEIPSIFTSGISNYATNYVSSFNTIKISDMSGALSAGGVVISITAWDTNGTVVLESGGAVPLKLQNLGTTSISGSDLAARFPSGSPKMYEFSIGSSNAIVTSLTTSVDGTIKTPTVFTIGGYGGI
jgi:hypothetical protein